MKFFVVFAALIACGLAAPSSPAVRYIEKRDGYNQFAFYYETEDGTIVEQHGRLIPGPEGLVMIMGGRTQYTAPNGQVFVTTWGSDLNGFKAEGDHIPQEPKTLIRSF